MDSLSAVTKRNSNPEISAFVANRPSHSVIRATWNDQDSGRRVGRRSCGLPCATSGEQIGRQRQIQVASAWTVRWIANGRHSTTPTGSQICFLWNRAKDGCSSNRAHACEFCLESHKAFECPPKVRGRQEQEQAVVVFVVFVVSGAPSEVPSRDTHLMINATANKNEIR